MSRLAAPAKSIDFLNRLRVIYTRRHLQESLSLFYGANSELQSQQAYTSLFKACAEHGDIEQGISLHSYMLSNQRFSSGNIYISNHLINMYAKCGYLSYAQKVFDEMSERNVVSWTVLISGYARAGSGHECSRIFSSMLAHCRPNEFTLSTVLTSCNATFGRQVHGFSIKIGADSSIFVANALISLYAKGPHNAINEAWTVFHTAGLKNCVSWNSMISGFQCCGLGMQAIGLFVRMHSAGIRFDRATLLSVLSSLHRSSSVGADLGLKFSHLLHGLSVKSGFISEIEVATALIKAYSETREDFTICYKLFTEVCSRDIVSWTGIITACAENEPERALFLFRQLLRETLHPDWYTFSIVLKACAGLVTTRHASVIHAQVIKSGVEVDTVLNNALVHAYSRCGSLALSKRVFDGMGSRDLVSWNSILKAYALHSQADKALRRFSQMDVKPDPTTFVTLLSACSHSGLVEEGITIFKSMSEKHGLAPQLDHYACMVDILGRAGRLLEAEKVIKTMPMEPDSVVWSALLGSCSKHGETRLAKLAADKLKELEPNKSLSYIIMSNIYSADGRFSDAGNSMIEMKRSKVIKEPGLSWIEIGNQVHEFASGGRRHPERKSICTELEKLIARLKEIGYVPETNMALQDVEEEHKEEQLFYHSEKLALMFFVMKGGKTIQIMKNIRICVDCHNFMKLASNLLAKEIVVRDSNRFHHFRHGLCSCNDYCDREDGSDDSTGGDRTEALSRISSF